MLLDTLFFCFLFHCVNCEEKKICITKDTSIGSIQCDSKIEEIISGSDLTTDISAYVDNSDTDITLYLIGSNTEFNFKLNIFNNKNLKIQFNSASTGNFDSSGISNIDMLITFSGFTNIYPTVNFKGSSLNDEQTSIDIQKVNLGADFSEINLKHFSTQDSTFSFSKFTVNSLQINANADTDLTFNDNSAMINSQLFTFSGEKPHISIILRSNRQLVVNNQASISSSIPFLSIQTAQSVTFKGNDYIESNSISFLDCPSIITEISYLPISSFAFSGSTSSDVNLKVNKALAVEGSFAILSSRNLIIDLSENTGSRVSIKIDTVALETGKIQILSSWIDLTINDFTFKSTTAPLTPCIGYGGSSTLTANNINLNGQTSLSFNSISIKLDFNEQITDDQLPNLVNSQWDIITFKSFTDANAVENFDSITFTPENINGFGNSESNRIISIKSTVTSDYIVKLTASSISSIPYIVCYVRKNGKCTKGGTNILYLSDLPNIVPADRKSVVLIINKAATEIDLSSLHTTGAEFTIEYDSSTYPITSISMGSEFPNTKIDHIIFNGISFGTGSVILNSREITINQCELSSDPTITFNENSIVNIDQSSFDELNSKVSNSFPQTNLITPMMSVTSFEISNDQYIFTSGSNSVSYSKVKLPKFAFQIQLDSNDDYSLTYKATESTTIDSVDLTFVSNPTQLFNPKITVTFEDIDFITSANNIGINFGTFNSENTVDFSTYKQSSYFKITGQNVKIIPDDKKPNGKICTCKETPCDSFCEEDYTQVSYSNLQQSIEAYSGDSFRIVVVGDQGGSSPILPIGSLNNKNVIVVGAGQNAKIQIDSSSEFNDESKTIEFSQITIAPSTGNNFVVSNLKLSKDTIVDSSFNSVSLNVDNLECDISNLIFSSVSIQKSLVLRGNEANTNSNTKVSFEAKSKFTFTLPNLITISGSKLTFNNLEIDLSNVIADFTLPTDSEVFTINANNGNIDSIESNIELAQSSQLNSVHFTGTWGNQNPEKFIVFKDFSSDILLDSEDIPVDIEYAGFQKIELGKEKVGIAGKVSLSTVSFGEYKIATSITDSVSTFSIKEIAVPYVSSGTINIEFESSNINLDIDTLTLTSKFKIICFDMLIDLNHQNQVNIVNAYEQTRSQALKYTVKCTITESLNHPKMPDFIYNNHTLITVNKENTIVLQNTITFDERAPQGFNSDNFMLTNDDSKLTFYTVESPIDGQIDLYYGNCEESCKGTQIKDENLASINSFLPKQSSLVVITFYESVPDNLVLNIDISDLSIQYLSLKSYSEIKSVPVKFGNTVSNLEAESISMKNDENDRFTIKTAKLTKGASFSSNAKLDNLESLTIDKESIFTSSFSEFSNSLEIVLELSQPTELALSYTTTGMKITNDQSKEFNIDVTKLTNVNLFIKSTESPKISLENDVTELKQVQSFVLDSSLIHIGSNWNLLKTDTPLVHYTIKPQEKAVSVVTDSFPFEAWDLMYNYAIHFSDAISPFSYSEEYEINGKQLTFSTFSPSTSTYNDVVFEEISMNGESTIKLASDETDKSLIINDIKVKKSSTSKVINALIKNEIILEPASSLNDDFSLSNEISEIELQWDLDQMPLFNPSNLITVVPEKIDIVYVGRSTEGREQQFKDFLSEGIVLIKNIDSCEDTISKIHFKSETSSEFNEGDSLSLKCQCTNNNEIQLILDDKIDPIPPESSESSPAESSSEPSQAESSSESSPAESSSEPSPAESSSESSSSSQVTTGPTLYPTPVYPLNGPTVDDNSYLLNGNSVEFTKNGYKEADTEFTGNDNNKDVLLVNTQSTSLSVSTTKDQPNKDFYLSPNVKNTQITIPNIDYGQGEIGIHANSNNPTINLPSSKVSVKFFNDEESEVSLNLNDQQSNSIMLHRLLINNGAVKFNLPSGVSSLNFDKVEVYNNGNVQSLLNKNQVETNINFLDMKSDSTTTLNNARFGETIKSAPKSKLIIIEMSKFNQNTVIELTETSLIDFGNSVIEGVCKEIKLNEVRLSTKSKHQLEESEVQLVCGSRFNCSSWLPKYSGNIDYPTAKCINFKSNNEICLVASSKSTNDDNEKKPTLSGGAIAGICIACVVVVGILIGVVLYCTKKNHSNKVLQYNSMENNTDELDDNPGNI